MSIYQTSIVSVSAGLPCFPAWNAQLPAFAFENLMTRR
jgi:hypothetical protein